MEEENKRHKINIPEGGIEIYSIPLEETKKKFDEMVDEMENKKQIDGFAFHPHTNNFLTDEAITFPKSDFFDYWNSIVIKKPVVGITVDCPKGGKYFKELWDKTENKKPL